MNNENAVVLVGNSWKNVPTQTISAIDNLIPRLGSRVHSGALIFRYY